jgi:hypothetical protein
MGVSVRKSRGRGGRIGRYTFCVGVILCFLIQVALVGSPTDRAPAIGLATGGSQPRSGLAANFSEGSQFSGSCDPITVTVTLNGTAIDGVPPYDFTWDFADHSSLGLGPDVRHTYAGYGNFDVTLWVVDAVGDNVSVTHEVIAPPPPCPVPIFNLASDLGSSAGWLLVGMGGLAGVVILGVFLRVRGGLGPGPGPT